MQRPLSDDLGSTRAAYNDILRDIAAELADYPQWRLSNPVRVSAFCDTHGTDRFMQCSASVVDIVSAESLNLLRGRGKGGGRVWFLGEISSMAAMWMHPDGVLSASPGARAMLGWRDAVERSSDVYTILRERRDGEAAGYLPEVLDAAVGLYLVVCDGAKIEPNDAVGRIRASVNLHSVDSA